MTAAQGLERQRNLYSPHDRALRSHSLGHGHDLGEHGARLDQGWQERIVTPQSEQAGCAVPHPNFTKVGGFVVP